MHYILMGDIINSREKEMKLLWIDFNKIIEEANRVYRNFMLSPLEIKTGDEFQVIMKDIHSALALLLYLNTYFMYENIKMRFVIGYGKIESEINNTSENNMLGHGLTATYEVLNDKKNKNRYRFYVQNNEKTSVLLNSIGYLLTEMEKRTTKKQYEYLYYKLVLKKEVEQISEAMGVTKRSIYNFEKTSNIKLIQKTFLDIEKVLS